MTQATPQKFPGLSLQDSPAQPLRHPILPAPVFLQVHSCRLRLSSTGMGLQDAFLEEVGLFKLAKQQQMTLEPSPW